MSTEAILPRPMTIDEFEPLVGEVFLADCDPESVELTLVEASTLRDSAIGAGGPFILIFRTEIEAQLMPGIYTLQSGDFGPAAISLHGVLPERDAPTGTYYQAVFN